MNRLPNLSSVPVAYRYNTPAPQSSEISGGMRRVRSEGDLRGISSTTAIQRAAPNSFGGRMITSASHGMLPPFVQVPMTPLANYQPQVATSAIPNAMTPAIFVMPSSGFHIHRGRPAIPIASSTSSSVSSASSPMQHRRKLSPRVLRMSRIIDATHIVISPLAAAMSASLTALWKDDADMLFKLSFIMIFVNLVLELIGPVKSKLLDLLKKPA